MLYHITTQAEWDAAEETYSAPSLTEQGFIHLSATPDQVNRVLQAIYAGQDDLIVLCIDPAKLTAEVKHEPPDLTIPAEHYEGELFPHLYGTLDADAVTAVHPLVKDGTFIP